MMAKQNIDVQRQLQVRSRYPVYVSLGNSIVTQGAKRSLYSRRILATFSYHLLSRSQANRAIFTTVFNVSPPADTISKFLFVTYFDQLPYSCFSRETLSKGVDTFALTVTLAKFSTIFVWFIHYFPPSILMPLAPGFLTDGPPPAASTRIQKIYRELACWSFFSKRAA
jgi:hypothetical protein